jgi:hypothetical protein
MRPSQQIVDGKRVRGVARKTLLYPSKAAQESNARFYLKGHFLLVAPALSVKYPKCAALAVLRNPLRRIQSAINYMRVGPSDPYLGSVPWVCLTQVVSEMVCRYCELSKCGLVALKTL